jgi:hypothetical protein
VAVWGARFPHQNHTITPDMKRALPAPMRSGSGLEGIAPLYSCRASGLRGDSVELVFGKRPSPPSTRIVTNEDRQSLVDQGRETPSQRPQEGH